MSTTFWTFLSQVLTPSASCSEAALEVRAKSPELSVSDSAYCQARAKLEDSLLERIASSISSKAAAKVAKQALWLGREVKSVDGTGIRMPDTLKNQSSFPQPSTQKTGCGFPVMKLVASFSLSSGCMEGWTEDSLHSHEARSLPKLAAGYAKGEVVVADRGFCSYANIASLSGIGCDSVFRLHQARKVDLRKGKALGPMDRIVEWKRPQRPRGFSAEQWSLVPSKLTLRVLRFRPAVAGFRSREIVLVTTLTDARAYPKSELQNLYMKRWAVELRFRELKTTMGMETLRCKSPKMIRKELRMHVIAFNLVRAMMLESLSMTFARIERISFKAAVASLRLFRAELPASASAKRIREVRKELIAAIAASTVPDRPGRSEPRAVKTRPKGYQLLTFPRRMMKISKSRKAS